MMRLVKKKEASGEHAGEFGMGRRRKRRRRAVCFACLALLLLAGAGFGAKALFFSDETRTALTEKTGYGSLSTAIEGTATTMPNTSLTVTAASTAEILEVFVSAGDTVEEGDLLYIQDDSELDDQIEEYQNQITDLEEELESSEAQRASIQETMAGLTLAAPFSGRLTEVAAEQGDEVQKGSRLAVLTDDSEMKLTQYFSYAYEGEVYVGMPAGVSIAALMTNLKGTVTEVEKVERITTEGTRCFAVTVTVENPGALTEGMTGAGYLLSDSGEKIYPAVEGTLECREKRILTVGAAGELTRANAADYRKVSAGEVLFVIDGSDYETQLASIEKKMTQAEEKIAACREKIAQTEEKRGDYTVTAGLSGKVIMVGVKAGEKPRQAGQTAVTIYNMDTMTISANIDELDIDGIEKGMRVRVVRSGSERDTSYEGTVTEVSYEATNANGVAYFPITVEIPSGGELAAGVNVSYSITTGDGAEGVLAPVAALKSTAEGTCLFVKSGARPENAVDLEAGVVPDGFYAVPVEVGTVNSRYAHILSGVEQDAEVFTRYQEDAPSNGGSTSRGEESEETQMFPDGEFGGGQGPAFGGSGGNRPDFSDRGGMGAGPMG